MHVFHPTLSMLANPLYVSLTLIYYSIIVGLVALSLLF